LKDTNLNSIKEMVRNTAGFKAPHDEPVKSPKLKKIQNRVILSNFGMGIPLWGL